MPQVLRTEFIRERILSNGKSRRLLFLPHVALDLSGARSFRRHARALWRASERQAGRLHEDFLCVRRPPAQTTGGTTTGVSPGGVAAVLRFYPLSPPPRAPSFSR